LASDGYHVVINYNNSEAKAEELLLKIREEKEQASIFKASVCDQRDVEDIASYIKKIGEIAIVVNNASSPIVHKSFKDLTWDDIQEHLNVQLKGTYNICREIVPLMEEKKRGKIINIISTVIDNVPPQKTYDYALAKSALYSFSKSLALELGPKNIQVNCVSPGMTNTSLIANFPERIKMVTAMQTPLRRIAEPIEVANIVSFLASSSADYLAGETIRVCGGQFMY
jgi:3-oxoacyl-[acyl-carrier protein] reductase